MDSAWKKSIVLIGSIAGLVWTFYWIWFMRNHFLDDAFIHLRYADYLRQKHFLTYDGVHWSYGCSSLLYVTILAVLSALSSSPYLPKAVSVLFFVALTSVLFFKLVKTKGAAQLLWAALLLITLSPMGFRWLTDGMETSLVAFTSVTLTLMIFDYAMVLNGDSSRYIVGLILALLAVFLRIEFVFVVLLGSAAAWLFRLFSLDQGGLNSQGNVRRLISIPLNFPRFNRHSEQPRL